MVSRDYIEYLIFIMNLDINHPGVKEKLDDFYRNFRQRNGCTLTISGTVALEWFTSWFYSWLCTWESEYDWTWSVRRWNSLRLSRVWVMCALFVNDDFLVVDAEIRHISWTWGVFLQTRGMKWKLSLACHFHIAD